ncbi:MAG TPA: bifunctional UDP-N-acetylglucosamine diphosphorylase/glucosamine-1-phosphate N-acetyltransferase GlmU [Actinomycetota bacterium]|nr:bifunctional UDP-N-acetylglucosamine diphosphorylase/glucosamine-1-phosphate N-acetyltransferase GlmU [Actinomycetota bacterium]
MSRSVIAMPPPDSPDDPNAPLAVVVLAAGAGKRLRSELPKVLHRAAGRPLVHHVLDAAGRLAGVAKTLVVVGNGAEQVSGYVEEQFPGAEFVLQTELLGTGDAVRRCRTALEGFRGTVLVLSGDSPLVTTATLDRLVTEHRRSGKPVTVLTATLPDPTGYGRIVRDENGEIVDLVEERDASPAIRRISEVSSGVWAFDPAPLFGALERIDNDNAQGEYYLPQAALVMAREGSGLGSVVTGDAEEIEGVNDRLQLAAAAAVLRRRKVAELARAGVTVEDPATAYVDVGSVVGHDTVIRPMTFLEGSTEVGAGCTIGPSTRLVDSVVEDGAEVSFAVVRESHIGPGATVGPFASLRPGTHLAAGAKAGTFVETKKSVIGEGSKVPHLSYVGDAEIGKGVNLAAGTITANYDTESKVKSRTVVEDGAFTGSDTTLIAPVRVGRNAGTGAGSVVTRDVEDGQIVAGVPARPFRKRKLEQP